jgi:hypothetical protein
MATAVTPGPRRSAAVPRALILGLALLVAACAEAAPTPAPTSVPTPVVTPDPHLPDPATAQQVFNGLGRAGLSITPNTATAGPADGDIVTKIFATYLGWPLDVTESRSSAALDRVVTWKAGEAPGKGEHPIAIAGANILVTWGPTASGARPPKPDARQADGLKELVASLEVLLAPLRARTVVAVTISTPVASAPSSPATAPPGATPTR